MNKQLYTPLSGGVAWFDLDGAERWEGPRRPIDLGPRRELLHRPRPGLWIACNEYLDGSLGFRQIDLESVGWWFPRNGIEVPDALYQDLDAAAGVAETAAKPKPEPSKVDRVRDYCVERRDQGKDLPALMTIAKQLGVSRRTVQRAFNEFPDIPRKHQAGGAGGRKKAAL